MADVGAAAELAGEVADVDDTDVVAVPHAVLLAEQGDRTGGLGARGVPDTYLGGGEEVAVAASTV
ncbi:hypothetical protein [Streptomyces sp. NPDC004284]|uniref:hypothetical protein n=1 Tax=Streptomyces sp. NPDC004284 TaxID=3364695 RepID=UPI0036A357BE